jgi:hypothetical protein
MSGVYFGQRENTGTLHPTSSLLAAIWGFEQLSDAGGLKKE